MLRMVFLDMARENGITTKLGVIDFRMYHDFLKALYKSYLYASEFDKDGSLESNIESTLIDLKALLNFIANKDDAFETEYLKAMLSKEAKDDEFIAVINTIPEYLMNCLSEIDDNSYRILRGCILVLNKAIKSSCTALKRLYAEKIIELNCTDGGDNLAGKVLLRSMQSLKKSYFDNNCSKYTVSARVVDTSKGSSQWYNNREVALLYDFDWQSLVCMYSSDLVTDNDHKIDYDKALELGTLQEKLFVDYQLPLEIGMCINWCGVYPVAPIEILGVDNEVLFTPANQPIGIVVSEEYYENHLISDDYAGVKIYSSYAEIPIYRADGAKYVKVKI